MVAFLSLLAGLHPASLHPRARGSAADAGPAAARLAADQFPGAGAPTPLAASMGQAYQFLDQMMDLYTTGPEPRLVQSYTGGPLGEQGDTSAAVYDNALAIDAYLAEGTADGLARAEAIGQALLYVQANDPYHDGRLANAYAPAPLDDPADIQATDPGSSTGVMAWAGLALAQLYAVTHVHAYLTGAIALGGWIQSHCRDNRGAGGYTGGHTASGAYLAWKSTEHNIDVYAFFRLLARESADRVWWSRAAWARHFLVSMWDAAQGRFYLGTTGDGVTPNDAAQVEDVNSWSYLALQDPEYAASVNWDVANLGVSAGGYSGVSACAGDRTGVWFEGTAHVADALEFLDQPGAAAQAASYLADIAYAQADGPNADGLGIMAASEDGLTDCEGDALYSSLHTGTTAWYILAADGLDPVSGAPLSAQQAAGRISPLSSATNPTSAQ